MMHQNMITNPVRLRAGFMEQLCRAETKQTNKLLHQLEKVGVRPEIPQNLINKTERRARFSKGQIITGGGDGWK